MKPRQRAAIILAGVGLLHVAFILPDLRTAPAAAIESLLLLLFISTAVFFAASRLAEPRQSLISGTTALLFFLLSPAVVRQSLLFHFTDVPVNALGTLTFVCAWLFMENWSVFMRSLVLAFVYGLGLWFKADALVWVPLAMVPWVLFNRRPLPAAGTLLTVLIGGGLLFGASWTALCVVTQRLGMILQPMHDLSLIVKTNMQALGIIDTNHWPSFLLLVTLPWFLLTLWTAWERFKAVLVQRRADVAAFTALLIGIVMMVCLLEGPRSTAVNSDLLMTLLALSAPLVACDLASREFILSRSSRVATGLGFGLTGGTLIFVSLISPEWLTTRLVGQGVILLAMLIAMAVSRAVQANRPLDIRGHWRAVLSGSALACFLVVNGILGVR